MCKSGSCNQYFHRIVVKLKLALSWGSPAFTLVLVFI